MCSDWKLETDADLSPEKALVWRVYAEQLRKQKKFDIIESGTNTSSAKLTRVTLSVSLQPSLFPSNSLIPYGPITRIPSLHLSC